MRSFFAEGLFETDEGEKLQLVCDFYTIDVVEQVTGLNWDIDIIPQLVSPPRSLTKSLSIRPDSTANTGVPVGARMSMAS